MLQPRSINSTAIQSSSGWFVGGLPLRPKSNTVGTIAAPKWRIQMWLAATRAARGLSREVIQFASAVRRPVLSFGYILVIDAYVADGRSTAALAASSAAPWSATFEAASASALNDGFVAPFVLPIA